MMRLRPENFPQVRIAQLAMLYYQNRLDMSRLIEAADREAIHQLLQTNVSDYWTSHYSFKDEESPQSGKRISPASIDLIIMNSVVPLLFAYGRYKGDDSLCDRAFDLMEQLKPENNRYIRDWTHRRSCSGQPNTVSLTTASDAGSEWSISAALLIFCLRNRRCGRSRRSRTENLPIGF